MRGSVPERAALQIRGPGHHAREHRERAHTDEGDTDQLSQHFLDLLAAGPWRPTPGQFTAMLHSPARTMPHAWLAINHRQVAL